MVERIELTSLFNSLRWAGEVVSDAVLNDFALRVCTLCTVRHDRPGSGECRCSPLLQEHYCLCFACVLLVF